MDTCFHSSETIGKSRGFIISAIFWRNHFDAHALGDYATAAAFEADAQALSDGIRELRSLEGQVKEKDTITGDFNARAMEAMMRGGGGQRIEQEQLAVQQQMEKHLKTLTTKIEKPSVVATD